MYSKKSVMKIKALTNSLYFVFFTTSLFSQTQGIAYTAVGKGVSTTFVTDYHCLGINSSALGWGTGYEDKRCTMGSSEFGFGMYSDALTSDKLKNLYKSIKDNVSGKSSSQADLNAQKLAAADYAQAGVSIFLDYNWAGFSFQGEKFGGIAFNIRESYSYYSKFNQQLTDLVFRGSTASLFDSLTIVVGTDTTLIANRPDISQDSLNNVVLGTLSVPLHLNELTMGSQVKMVWNRSYNFGYGRKIFGKEDKFELFGGIGGRYIQSMAMFNLESNVAGLTMYSSITPSFNINYGSIANSNPSNFAAGSGIIPKSVGDGYGVDFSASVLILKKLRMAMSINNIGQVTYKRNVYSFKDTLFTNLSVNGVLDYNVTSSINDFLTKGGLLTLQGEEKYVLKNASDFRFGASLEVSKAVHFGFDVVAPFNKENPGSIRNPVYSFGGEFRPVKWIALSCGYFGGGVYQNNIPVGINFILKNGSYEVGISSRDALTFFMQNRHNVSAAFGFARFRF